MSNETYRRNVNALAIIAAAAFAGGNLFIGLSIGAYWLNLEPLQYMAVFWTQFTTFLYTIMPLFTLTLVGLVLSARLDWSEPKLKRLWILAIVCYVITSLITMGYHLPENLRLREATYTADEASSARTMWLLLHIPRVLLAFAIPWFAFKAVFENQTKHRNDE